MTDSQSVPGHDLDHISPVSHRELSSGLLNAQRQILEINEALNSRLPIHSLPDEILLEVFRLVRTEPWIDDYQGSREYIEDCWLAVQGVCRHWRTVLCSDPQSWRTIEVYSGPQWLRVCLARCAGVHADLILHGKSLQDSDTLSLLSQWTSAVRSLTIKNLEPNRREFVATWIMARRWPVLEQLDVRGRFPVINHPSPLSVDVGITAENAPSLRVLHLEYFSFHPPAERSLYSQLHALHLSICDWPVSFEQLIDVLEHMKSVEVLYLGSTFPRWPETLARIVTLPRLRSLTLANHGYRRTIQLLEVLHLPAVTFIRLHMDAHVWDPQLPMVAAAIPRDRSLAFLMLAAITSVHVCATHAQFFGLYGCSPASSHVFKVTLTSSPSDAHARPSSVSQALADVVNIFSLSPISKLTLSTCGKVSESEWLEVFNCFPGLEVINVWDCSSATVHTLWTALSRTPCSSDCGSVYCQRLRVTTVPSRSVFETEGDTEMMLCALRARRERGHMLQELVVYNNNRGQVEDDRLSAYLTQVKDCVGVLKY